MNLSDFDYQLPRELIAQHPLKERQSCRLMVVDRSAATIDHKIFSELPGYFSPEDCIVLNDTRVLHCRLVGKRKSGGRVEVFLLSHLSDSCRGAAFKAMISPARVKTGERIFFGDGNASCTVVSREEVCFEAMTKEEVYAYGQVPLPPYIKRAPSADDNVYYQTVFARQDGSVAAPTAGLHFTPEMLDEVRRRKTGVAFLTLHVGTATFKPVKCEDVTQHEMGKEYFSIPEETLALLKREPRVCAVCTTVCRSLETWGQTGRREGETQLFIYPGYSFKVVDRLLTNFHLPKTTLFMLACAFGGTELVKRAYAEAVEKKYRFYSYDDAMLIV
jgi:S-adenosylmethionine:tRNA ribosyltransferase-isomerase